MPCTGTDLSKQGFCRLQVGGSRGACFSSNWREKRRECSSSDLSFGPLSPAPALLVSFVAAMAERLRANSQALSVFRVATFGHRAEVNQPAGEVSHASLYFGRQGDRNNVDDGCSCNIKLSSRLAGSISGPWFEGRLTSGMRNSEALHDSVKPGCDDSL